MTQEDRDLILRVEAKLDRVIDRLDRIEDGMKDHESRIRSTERWKYSIPLGVIAGLAMIVGNIIGGR